ncbi:MAG: 16S rRNA (guanine(966)-N(2))-methyltransferase RsmD [Eubacteriales bacterium]|nr:16S rRNA (guanine(966)-N(2))-methyltransferase RsmD [Eubacteriales bacterium]
MRVVSGTARGCRLQPVPGMDTRPTTDRVKENVFNLIQDHVRGAQVLDLFAGTGQLGIEALSRGAAHCDLVEYARAAYQIVCKNVQTAHVADRAHVHLCAAETFVQKAAKERYDLVFLDPPYGGRILENALLQIERFDILTTDGIIICESAVDDRFTHGLSVVRERRYGTTLITVLRRQDSRTD